MAHARTPALESAGGRLLKLSQSTMQHLEFTLQANDLVVESLAAQPFTLELLDGFPQRMNLGGPAILVGGLPRLRALCPCQSAIAFLESGHTARFCILQLPLEFSDEGRIRHGVPQPTARRNETARLTDDAVALAQGGAQCASCDFLAGAAHRFNGLPDLLVSQLLVHVSGARTKQFKGYMLLLSAGIMTWRQMFHER